MGLLARITKAMGARNKRASLENPATSLSDPAAWLVAFAGGQPTAAGVPIDENSALRITTVYGCVRVLASLLAMLPVSLFERTPSGRRLADEHPLQRILHVRPNDEQTPYFYHQTMTASALLWGNGYAAIVRGEGRRPAELIPLLSSKTTAERKNGQLRYVTRLEDTDAELAISPNDIVHIPGLSLDGIKGLSPIGLAREAFALSAAAQQFGAQFFGSGGQLSGVLEHPAQLSTNALKNLRESWDARHSGIGNAHKLAILEEGMKYNRIGIPPEDAQFLETRKFQVSEITRMFGVPPHLVSDLEHATFSNIEQQDLDLVRHTLMPWLVRFEQEYGKKLLRPEEQRRYFFKFNVDALLRGDSAARSQFYREMFNIGALSQNDIREKEDLNPIDGGDRYFVPLNMAPIEHIDDVFADDDTQAPQPNEQNAMRAYEIIFKQAARSVLKVERDRLEKCARALRDGMPKAFARQVERVYAEMPAVIAKHFTTPMQSFAYFVGSRNADEFISQYCESMAGDFYGDFARNEPTPKAVEQYIASRDNVVADDVAQAALDGISKYVQGSRGPN